MCSHRWRKVGLPFICSSQITASTALVTEKKVTSTANAVPSANTVMSSTIGLTLQTHAWSTRSLIFLKKRDFSCSRGTSNTLQEIYTSHCVPCYCVRPGPTPTEIKQNKKRLYKKKVLLAGDESWCCTVLLLRSTQSPLKKPRRLRNIGTLFQSIGCCISFFITGMTYSVQCALRIFVRLVFLLTSTP